MAGTQTFCFTPVLGKRIRMVTLDQCGNLPVTGTPNSMITSGGFISVKMSAQIENGADIVTKKADGSLCVNTKVADSFKRLSVDMEFCGVDPGMLAMCTNAQIYQDAMGDSAGVVVPEGQITDKFSLELWTGIQGQCNFGGGAGAASASGYLLLPMVNAGIMGDIEVDGEKAVSFTMKGAYTVGANTWGVGPFRAVSGVGGAASYLPSALLPNDHLLLMQTNVAPPPSVCGLQTYQAQ